MANFTLLKGHCPICSGIRNGKRKLDCKQSGELIHCFSHNDPPPGFRFIGQSAIGQSLYAPEREQGLDPEQHRAELAKLRAEYQAQAASRLAQLPTVAERHQEILGFEAKLSEAQNADLLRRGLFQEEIDFALSQHWLFGCQDGYGITALDSATGMFCGAQRALDDRSQRKYDWGIFTGRNALKETGENPLFVWRSPAFDPSQPYEIKFCEGALKSLVRAFVEWRKNPQVILVGAAGGIFSQHSLTRVLSIYGEAERFTHLPDADSQNLKKKNLYAGYGKLAQAIPAIKFADWGQWRDKTKGDCDEYFGNYRRRSPWDWLKPFAFEETRRKAKERLQTSDRLTADLVISLAEFEALKQGDLSLRELTNQARDVFLQASRGLGKTEMATQVVKTWQRGIAPFHRKALAINGGGKLGFIYRTDLTIHKGQMLDGHGSYANHLAYCSESRLSLSRAVKNLLDQGAGCFVDEFDQQVKNLLMSATHGKDGRRKINIQNFFNDLTRAKNTLSVSADLTDFETKLFEQHTGRKPYVIQVEHHRKQRVDTVFEDEAQWWQKYQQLQDEGQRILVCCTRKADTKLFGFRGAVAVHADNTNEFKDFLAQPDLWLGQHQPKLMAVSPILGTGFSIQGDHFDGVMLYGFADDLTAPDLMQFLDRYRPHVPRYIWVEESNHQFNYLTPEACFKARLMKARASHLDGEQWIDHDEPYFHYQAEKNWSLAHLRADLLARLERDTETVIYELCQLSPEDKRSIMARIASTRREFKKYDAILTTEAENLTDIAYRTLKTNEEGLTEEQRRAIYKYELADWRVSNPQTITADDILQDQKGQRRRHLEKLEMQAFPKIAAALDQASIDRQRQYGVSQQDVTHHALRVKALEDIGIGKILDFVLSGGRWHSNHGIVQEAAAILARRRDELSLMGVKLTCGRQASPSAYFGALLRVFGLKTISRRITMEGSRVWVYQLDQDELNLTKADLIARLPRHMEQYGALTVTPETTWINGIYGMSIPSIKDSQPRYGLVPNALLDNSYNGLPPDPNPPPEPPDQISPVKPEKFILRIGEKFSFWDATQSLTVTFRRFLSSEIPKYWLT
ncbi:hypothetical protein FLX56_25990 [Synechococcus moorigangaii CMS01]|nr:hypothetical protein [Synechococcus moorigangaii CMS01]